jgi:hypothetical protein
MQDPAAAAAAAAAANAGPRAGDLNQQPLGCVLPSKVVCVLVLGNLQSYAFFVKVFLIDTVLGHNILLVSAACHFIHTHRRFFQADS